MRFVAGEGRRFHISFTAFCSAAALLSLLSTGALSGAMSLPGKLDVNPLGAANYNISIALPPGTAGVAPPLSLNYNSHARDGFVGVGWTLSGLSAISRCPKTMAQDGSRGGINYDANDRFCMDGQRLVAVNGAYGADGTQYRTEVETFSKIISHGTTGSGPSWFEVHTKSGQAMEFGNTSDSRILAQGKASARTWAANKVSDTKGNYFSVAYTNDTANGQFYPVRIDYTGNAAASLSPYNSVQFVYATRPDIIPQYQAGSLMQATVRLTNIKAYVGPALVSDYRLTYQQSGSANRSRLTSLTACDGGGACLPATSFNWTNVSASFGGYQQWSTNYTTGAGWIDQNVNPRMLADVNGDGLPDIVGFGSGAVAVSLNTGTSFAAQQNWSANYTTGAGCIDQNVNPRMLVDVNGDGLLDIVGFGSGAVAVSLNTEGSFAPQQNWSANYTTGAGWIDQNVNPRMLVDVNGDGLPDIVGFGSGAVAVSLNTGTSFAPQQNWSANYTTGAGWIDQNVNPRMLVDVNGDGLPDIVGFGSGAVAVSFNTGGGFTPQQNWSANYTTGAGWIDQNVNPRMLVDVNGDGLPDIVGFGSGAVAVSLNTGTSFAPQQNWSTQFTTSAGWTNQNVTPRMLVDVNGDGLSDLIGFGGGAVAVSFNTGISFSGYQQWTTQFTTGAGWIDQKVNPRSLADTSATGFPSVVGFGSRAVAVSPGVASGPTPDILSSVADGLGMTTTITYSPATNSSVVTKGTGTAFPNLDIITPTYVVSRVDASNGIGGTYSSAYSYSSGRLDAQGRGFLGFAQTTVKDLQTNIASTTTYRQDFPCVGAVASTTRSLMPGTPPGGAAGQPMALSQSFNTYQFSNASGGASVSTPSVTSAPYRVSVAQNVAQSADLDGSSLPTVTSSYQYDAFSNPTQTVVSTSDGFSKTTASTYSNDTTLWYLGRLTRASVTSVAP